MAWLLAEDCVAIAGVIGIEAEDRLCPVCVGHGHDDAVCEADRISLACR